MRIDHAELATSRGQSTTWSVWIHGSEFATRPVSHRRNKSGKLIKIQKTDEPTRGVRHFRVKMLLSLRGRAGLQQDNNENRAKLNADNYIRNEMLIKWKARAKRPKFGFVTHQVGLGVPMAAVPLRILEEALVPYQELEEGAF